MKKSCRETRGLLVPFLDGELPEERARQVADHLADCPDCRRELAALRAVDAFVRKEDQPPRLADDYWEWHRSQVWHRIRAGRRERRQRVFGQRFLLFRTGAMVAGAAVVLVIVIAGWHVLGPGARRPGGPLGVATLPKGPAPVERLAAEAGQREAGVRHEVTETAERRTGALPRAADAEAGEIAGRLSEQPAAAAGAARSEVSDVDRLRTDGAAAADASRGVVTGGSAAKQELVPGRPPPAAKADGDVLDETREPTVTLGLAATAEETCDQPPELVDVPSLPSVLPEDTATVFVRALVEPDGTVSETELERSSGVELLDTIAARNVQQARFLPGYFQGEPVRCWARVVQNFVPEGGAEAGGETPAAERPDSVKNDSGDSPTTPASPESGDN